jgi:hypothetical protein
MLRTRSGRSGVPTASSSRTGGSNHDTSTASVMMRCARCGGQPRSCARVQIASETAWTTSVVFQTSS